MKPTNRYTVVGCWTDTDQTFVHIHEAPDVASVCFRALEYNASYLSDAGLLEANDDPMERALALTNIVAVFEGEHVNLIEEVSQSSRRCSRCPSRRAVCVDKRLAQLLDYARMHGADSEPDHEVGDLLDIVRQCWKRLSAGDRESICTFFRVAWDLDDGHEE